MNAKALSILHILVFFVLPLSVFADVKISEIMYDLDGTDTDREWIEIVNTGHDSVDLAQFKLFEANSNHGLIAVSGGSVLAAGQAAVIALSPSKFLLDWPSYAGILFDSSFSLSNTGESLGIKNGDMGDDDSISYTSEMGAQGDGQTLTRGVGVSFTPAAPTPGVHSTTSAGGSSTSATTVPPVTVALPNTSAAQTKTITIHAGNDRTVSVGAGVIFTADVYGTEGKFAENPRVIWSFGNGESREGKSVEFTYAYPGRYLVSAVGAIGEYTATARFTVEAAHAQTALRAESDGSLTVFNLGKHSLDISRWQISRAGTHFRFPKETYILAQEGVRVPQLISGLPSAGDAKLMYPNGEIAQESTLALLRVELPEIVTATTSVASSTASTTLGTRLEDLRVRGTLVAPASAVTAAKDVLGVEKSPSQQQLWFWLLGVFGISILGIGAVLIFRLGANTKHEEHLSVAQKEAEKYTLVE